MANISLKIIQDKKKIKSRHARRQGLVPALASLDEPLKIDPFPRRGHRSRKE
jgi:hypothetical protein